MPNSSSDAHPLPSGQPEVTIRPAAGDWPAHPRADLDDDAARFRHELGLPTDRPVIMSGHQAAIWHPGILAKLIALQAYVAKTNAAAAWVVVDHDENEPLTIHAPSMDERGRLARSTFAPPKSNGHVPACRQAAWDVREAFELPVGVRPPAAGIEPGLRAINAALASHRAAANAADQAMSAAIELARPVLSPARVQTFNAALLAETTLFRSLVVRMQSDPVACISARNAAVAQFPDAGIAPLADNELPLWSIAAAPGSPRVRVFAEDLASLPGESLAPRALLLTGLLRMAGCELFIHGIGGEKYDRITERWLHAWLGRSLAQTTMVTATLRLRIPGQWPTEDEIAHAAWEAHHARHDPAVLGDAARAQQKQEFLGQIQAAPPRSTERAALFAQMHNVLHESERLHADRLKRLDDAAAAMRARADEAAIATDRTWPFPLYEPDQLASLRDAIAAQFA